MIHAIFACDENWGIGKNGALPWPHNSADLQWFKNCTGNTTVVMGRKTWESLPVKPLPKRRNLVVSKNEIPGVETRTIEEIISTCEILSSPVWIIGGAKLLEHTIGIIDEIWLSRIKGVYDCDTFLPKSLIQEKFEFYERYFDGSLTTEKYRKIKDETIS